MSRHRPWREIRRKAASAPYRVELHFTTAAHGTGDLKRRHDELVERARELGFNFEYGTSSVMDLEDLIEDSPTARQLRDLGSPPPAA
jgi:hypothetical protein